MAKLKYSLVLLLILVSLSSIHAVGSVVAVNPITSSTSSASTGNAPYFAGSAPGQSGSFYSGWDVLSIAAAAISVLAAILLIQISRIFGLRNLEQTAKLEMVYALSTVLIVVMVLGLVQLGESVLAGSPTNPYQHSVASCFYLSTFNVPCTAAVYFPDQTTLIDWMKLYMKTPNDCVQAFMQPLYWASIPLEFCSSIYAEIFMSEVASGFGCKPFAERINNAVQQITFLNYIYDLMSYILDFIKYFGGFFFSVGVVMRAFPPTRGAGAYLMAIAFGLYFVFPLTYILVFTISAPSTMSQLIVPASTALRSSDDLNPGVTVPVAPAAPGTSTDIGTFQYVCLVPQITDAHTYECQSISMSQVSSVGDRISSMSDALNSLFSFEIGDFTRHLANAVCLFPLISGIVLITFVLNATGLFGGNIPEIGRGLVKLI